MAQQPLIAIVGPTGSGKTALALAMARDLSLRGPDGPKQSFGEIISADSRQVYLGMDIGTGKERVADVPQHLIDIVDPDEEFTLADFLTRAKCVIADIHARGRVPIVVGGTGLYVQALVENWDIPAVKPNPALRAELEKKSVSELQKELAAIDPGEAERLGAGKRYLVRALEMWHATGRKPSALKTKNEPLYDALVIGIVLPREELYRRIDARVDDMFARGLVNEVRGLLKKYPANLPAFRTIGYREIIERPAYVIPSGVPRSGTKSRNLTDEISRLVRQGGLARNDEIETLKCAIKNHTHAYARRQLTWLRRMKYVEWVRNAKEALSRVDKDRQND